MKKKISWIILVIFIILLFLLSIAKSIDDYAWVCTENGWEEYGKPKYAKPKILCGKIEDGQVVKKFLDKNISNISPTKEVLGGKFYITKIDWTGNNSGIVEYEDGHIALKASFEYKVEINEQSNYYSVKIEKFKIIE